MFTTVPRLHNIRWYPPRQKFEDLSGTIEFRLRFADGVEKFETLTQFSGYVPTNAWTISRLGPVALKTEFTFNLSYETQTGILRQTNPPNSPPLRHFEMLKSEDNRWYLPLSADHSESTSFIVIVIPFKTRWGTELQRTMYTGALTRYLKWSKLKEDQMSAKDDLDDHRKNYPGVLLEYSANIDRARLKRKLSESISKVTAFKTANGIPTFPLVEESDLSKWLPSPRNT